MGTGARKRYDPRLVPIFGGKLGIAVSIEPGRPESSACYVGSGFRGTSLEAGFKPGTSADHGQSVQLHDRNHGNRNSVTRIN